MPSVTGKVSKGKSRKRLAATLEAAVARHEAGDLRAAEAGYREILGISASEPRALHLLGTLHAQTGPGARVRVAFAAHGVTTERLDLVGWTKTRADHLALYGRIDLCLDTFPYNGGTTTCEALWMGVPVATFAGDRYVSRFGPSILSQGRTRRAGRLRCRGIRRHRHRVAGDTERRAELRRHCRPRMADSSLCQPKRFTRSLEEASLAMYEERCAVAQPG